MIQAIAEIELSAGEWPELIPSILAKADADSPPNVQIAALKTVGMICETCSCRLLLEYSNTILTCVATAITGSRDNVQVQLAGMCAFYNSLEFICGNFLVENERNFIMSMACDATLSTNHDVMQLAYECLVKIITYYYQFMEPYMSALLSITLKGMKSGIDEVVIQAIEFWSSLCEREAGIVSEETIPTIIPGSKQNFNFSSTAANELVSALWPLMKRESDDDDDEEWNVNTAAATCLSLLALSAKDAVVSPAAALIQQNISSQDWSLRDAAIMTLGSIVSGPDPSLLEGLVVGSANHIFDSLSNGNSVLKDTSSWTLGRILECLPFLVSQDMLVPLVQTVLKSLDDGPKAAANSAWCLMCLADCFDSSQGEQTSILSQFFEPCVSRLMYVGSHVRLNPNIRASAFEAISTFISNAPEDCKDLVIKVLVTVINEIESLVGSSDMAKSKDDQDYQSDYLGNVCAVLASIIRRLGKYILPMFPKISNLLLFVVQSPCEYSIVREDVFLAISALTTAADADHLSYLESFFPSIISCLQNYQDYQSYIIAVGVVGDMCRALENRIIPVCDSIMNILVQTFQAPDFNKNARSAVLSVFGDIALAIGTYFSVYSSPVMEVLYQQGQRLLEDINSPLEDYDYLVSVAEGIIDAYTGIVQGLKSEDSFSLPPGNVNQVFSFIGDMVNCPLKDSKLLSSIIGLIGDLADALPSANNEYRETFSQPWIKELLKSDDIYRSVGIDSLKIISWTREKVSKHSTLLQ